MNPKVYKFLFSEWWNKPTGIPALLKLLGSVRILLLANVGSILRRVTLFGNKARPFHKGWVGKAFLSIKRTFGGTARSSTSDNNFSGYPVKKRNKHFPVLLNCTPKELFCLSKRVVRTGAQGRSKSHRSRWMAGSANWVLPVSRI